MFSNEDQGRVYKNFKFYNLQGRGSCNRACPYVHVNHIHVVKMQNFSLFQGIKQTNWIYNNDDQS